MDLAPIRHDWTMEEIKKLYETPFLELIYQAAKQHRFYHDPSEVQVCHLVSVKTGGCTEDCKYCAQSIHYQTSIKPQPWLEHEEVMQMAKTAIAQGATRICLGVAWREVRDNKLFDQILNMVKAITDLGAEVCCTLGLLNADQAKRLAEAGLYAYNHNLDTSARFYKTIITTRTYEDRLRTLDVVEEAKLSVCCGGIIGMGETIDDRLSLLQTLANRSSHPESVPINLLNPIEGTPLARQKRPPIWEMVRLVGIARILMPKAMIRLSAGRLEMSYEQQALCFLAGANSLFSGAKLLTTPTCTFQDDDQLFDLLGLRKRASSLAKKPAVDTSL